LKIRAADAKEVGVGNPAEETCCYPNGINVTFSQLFVNKLSFTNEKEKVAEINGASLSILKNYRRLYPLLHEA
jgi:hypothetical protein